MKGAVAMATNHSIPLSSAKDTLKKSSVQVLFAESFAHLVQVLQRYFLPHLLGGLGLFLLMAYVTSFALFAHWTSFLKWVAILFVLLLYGVVAFSYCFFTSCVFALRLACVEWNDFIAAVIDLVQERSVAQLTDMNVGLTKPEAAHLVKGSVRDVFASVKHQQSGWGRAIAVLCLGFLAAVIRTVLSAKILKWSGRTIQLGKLFAGRATLVGAIFLNLHLLATLILGICYALGLSVLSVNIYFVFLLK